MTAINSAFSLIEILRRINNERQRIVITEGARYSISTYRNINLLFKSLKEQGGEYSDLFFAKLSCEIHDTEKYNNVVSLIEQEIESFETWYLSNAELVNPLFSYEAISEAVDKAVDFELGEERKQAEEAFNEIYEDEKVWHSLAKAYGSRSNCGRISEHLLSPDDRDYISDSLEAFKKHFNQSNVDLPVVYEEYEAKIKPRWKECRAKRDAVWKKCEEYHKTFQSELQEDVYAKIYGYLVPFNEFLNTVAGETATSENITNDADKKKERLGRYKDLSECIPRDDIYKKVKDVAGFYYNSHGTIDGVFGYMLMMKLKGKGLLNDRGCTQSHFGELLRIEFGAKCSFKDGGAVSDAKNKVDVALKTKLDDIFK